jgi:phosphatidylglycerol---prolipoprotein diacylglyceryl transferase
VITVDFDPVMFQIGSFQPRWYGFMYVFGTLIAIALLKRLSTEKLLKVKSEDVVVLVTGMFVSMLVFSRIFYVFIYNWDLFQNNFSKAFMLWRGGLSYHGGVVGLIVGLIVFCKFAKVPVFNVLDSCAVAMSQSVFWGRIGNFINGELYGRITTSPVGMIFKKGGPAARHPSQLYEAIFEGLILFSLLWLFRRKIEKPGLLIGVYIIGYGVFRYFIEFFRQPDSQLGYYLGGTTTMGQILCLGMILIGISILFFRKFIKN